MELKRSGSQPSAKGPAEYFTGNVRIDPLFQAADPSRVSAALVTFEPGPALPGTRIRLASG
jgi:quercetin dioxygenase-like cupin family protein